MRKGLVALLILSVFGMDARSKATRKVRNAKQVTLKKNKNTNNNENAEAKQAVLIDYDTGDILYENGARERCAPSSMTKLLTLYILFKALRDGRLHMDDELPVSEYAQSMEGSRSFFKAGTTAKVEDLIRSIVVHSGNDASVIVAEALSGSSELFAEEMNRIAIEEFHLTDSHFTNPSGLPDDDHYSTALDLAIIAQHLIKDFPEYYHYFSEKVFTVNGITQYNRNPLLGNSMGVDGLKTGTTKAGGHGLIASAKKDGKRLIAVVNGCQNERGRALAANNLLVLGYKEFVRYKTIKAGAQITTEDVWLGDLEQVGLCAHEDIDITVPRKFLGELKIEVSAPDFVKAPIAKGTKVGTLKYRYGKFISKNYDLYTVDSVKEASFLDKTVSSMKYLFSKSPYAKSELKKLATNGE